jgi:deoxyhypusine synthase
MAARKKASAKRGGRARGGRGKATSRDGRPHGGRAPASEELHRPTAAGSLATGFSDGLEPLVPLDLGRVSSVDDLVRAMSKTAFAGRAAGEAVDVLEAMIRDPGCLVVCTLSGAMSIAKMGLVLCDMIDRGWLQAVVSTGALMAHGFVEATGRGHFKHDRRMSDEELYEKGYDRVYDTLELEQNLDDVEEIVRAVLDRWDPAVPMSSAAFHDALGRWLDRRDEGRGILRSAHRAGIPVYVPAFTDSELGLDFALHVQRAKREGRAPVRYDAFADLEDFKDRVIRAESVGIFTIGGGVPRNWAQQVAPYLEITKKRLGIDLPLRRFQYGVRICPEPVHWGGLSGCTYSEGVSWGKFAAPSEGGRYAEVLADATVAWPLVARALLERFERKPAPRKVFGPPPLPR